MTLQLSSPAFAHRGAIPLDYTCLGREVSPPLAWQGVPAQSQSLALIVDDPDAPDPEAPRMVWCHWLLYNLPRFCRGLAEGVHERDLPAGTLQGHNDWHHSGYGGPCPPIGRHRYFFKLYALDTVLPDLQLPDKQHLETAMHGHIIEQAELIGLYEKY